jgi:hypothetical protein
VVVLTFFSSGRRLGLYVRLDTYARRISICALDEKGQVARSPRSRANVVSVLRDLDSRK